MSRPVLRSQVGMDQSMNCFPYRSDDVEWEGDVTIYGFKPDTVREDGYRVRTFPREIRVGGLKVFVWVQVRTREPVTPA